MSCSQTIDPVRVAARALAAALVILLALGCGGQRSSDQGGVTATRSAALTAAPQHCSTDAQCGASEVCSTTHGDPLGTGLCVAYCGGKAAPTSVCAPGQVADARGTACRCLAAVGAGSLCAVGASCGASGVDCLEPTAIWGPASPGGPVCVDTTAQTCSAGQLCPGGGACPTLVGQPFGYCPDHCGATSCRYDQVALGAGAACRCVPRDPIGRACVADGDCAWSESARACADVAGSKRCMPTGFCAATDVCGDGLDQDCDGADRVPRAEICGNGIDEDCDGADLRAVAEVCGDHADNDCDGKTDENPPCAPPQPWCHDDDGDGFCTECATATAAPGSGRWVPGCPAMEPAACGGDRRRYPTAPEACDGVDSNCNGMADEPCPRCGGTYCRPNMRCDAATRRCVPKTVGCGSRCSAERVACLQEAGRPGSPTNPECFEHYQHCMSGCDEEP